MQRDLGLVSRRVRRALAARPHRRRRHRPRALLDDRRQQVGQRPAGHPHPLRRPGGPRPQRQPHQHRRAARRDGVRRRRPAGEHRLGDHRRDDRLRGGQPARRPCARSCRGSSGAYSAVAITGSELVAFRDPHGVRPLVLGRLDDDGWCVASETCALDQIGARFERDVRPGEAVRLTSERRREPPGDRRRRAARCACSSTSTSPGPTARWRGARCGRRATRWASSWPGRARPRRTWSSACPTAARPRPSATRGSRASPTPRRSCATATSGAASSSPTRRCASRASG